MIIPASCRASLSNTSDARPRSPYELGLNETGALTWAERGEGGGSVSLREPGAGLWRRLGVAVMSILLIEWLL